jgi:TonB family protein
MTARMLLANIASYALQITVLVAAGAALARAFRLDQPRAMLAYWRTLLVACLVLPLCQPWNIVIPAVLSGTPAAVVSSTGAAPVPSGPSMPLRPLPILWPLVDVALFLLAAGAGARALWLTMGAWGLRRLRRGAVPLDPLPESIRHAQERLGTRAGMYVSDCVSSPITFGLLRPVVMFPPSVPAMPAHVQEAIAYHELLHVRRRDWLHEVLEQIVRTVLWFHPAVWWLTGRIQLTREQVVDQAAIRLTDSRERYIESLLAVARSSSPAAFAPASAFLRRHALKMRVACILQETTMTTRRLIASLTVSAAALTLAAGFAVRSFPLEAQGHAPVSTGEPIQVLRGGEHLLHGRLPEYPLRGVAQKIQGDVVVDLTLDARGEVLDARVLSGPDELRKATLEAVLQWHYAPSALSSTVTQATVRFQMPPGGFEKIADGMHFRGGVEIVLPDSGVEVRAQEIKIVANKMQSSGLVVYDEKPGKVEFIKALRFKDESDLRETLKGSPRLAEVRSERVTDATSKEVLAQAGVAVGDVITEDAARRIEKAAAGLDEHIVVEFHKEKKGLVVTILTR